jgi:hypothetical protein
MDSVTDIYSKPAYNSTPTWQTILMSCPVTEGRDIKSGILLDLIKM